jgi:8-oxo-dGTP pyrophosphatase MutT (NUDIX family)
MESAAVRETFEETGYPCELYAVTLETRAPAPGVNLGPYKVLEARASTEPFYMTVRMMKEGSVKTIWWYVAWVRGNDAEKVEGVAMSNEEGYVSEFQDIPDALEIYKGTKFEGIVVKAVELITNTLQEKSTD